MTNLIITTGSVTGANIEVRHAKNESSMIMDRAGTCTSVVLHKFAKVPWLKLRRDDSVLLDSELKIAALSTRPMAIEEIDSEEERQAHWKKKKETLGMDETSEIHKVARFGKFGCPKLHRSDSSAKRDVDRAALNA